MCDKSEELITLYDSMSNDDRWIISSSGRYMFVRLTVGYGKFSASSITAGFLAKFHYGKEVHKEKLGEKTILYSQKFLTHKLIDFFHCS